MNDDKQITQSEPAPIYLSKMAPAGVDGRVWARVLKQQLLSARPDGTEPPDEELLYFAQVSKSTGLDPVKREIYGIYRNVKQKDGTYVPKLSIQTGIDGFRATAEKSGKFAGSKEPEFEYDPEIKITVKSGDTDKLVPNKARVSVMKVIGDRVIDTTRTANWLDYYPGATADGMMWRKLPETMLSKVAEAQALRAAFPNCEGLYLAEEMQQPDEGPVAAGGIDIQKVAEQVKEAKTLESLMEIMNGLPMEQQKQLMELAQAKATELADKAEKPAKKPAKKPARKVVQNDNPKE